MDLGKGDMAEVLQFGGVSGIPAIRIAPAESPGRLNRERFRQDTSCVEACSNCELARSHSFGLVDCLPFLDGFQHLDVLDRHRFNRQRVLVKDHQVRELANLE